jgi:hypothetical protein
MRQMTLAHQAEFQRYSKKTRREQFLAEMDAVMPVSRASGAGCTSRFNGRDGP